MCCIHATRAHSDWIPNVDHYGPADYGNGYATQNISSLGQWTYFANRQLLEYNGIRWKTYELNNRSKVCGVMVSRKQQRIWAGGTDEFGFFEVGEGGVLRYHCLSDSMPAKERSGLGSVCAFYESGSLTYACCDHQVLTIIGNKANASTPISRIISTVLYKSIVYAATDQQLYMLVGHQFMPAQGAESLKGKRINAMINFRGSILIATADDGLYLYNGSRVEPFSTNIDGIFRDGIISCAATQGDLLAIGTLHFGLMVLNLKTGDVAKFDDSCGLQSNVVKSVAFDDGGNVWTGLDYGIDHVLLASPFTSLYVAPRAYGLGFTALLEGNDLYLGTDRGLFYTPYPVKYEDRQTVLYGTETPAASSWYLYKHTDGDLLMMHEKGFFVIKNRIAHRTTDLQEVWFCIPVKEHPDMLFVGAHQGVYLVQKFNGEWHNRGRIIGIPESGRFLRQEKRGELKVYNPNLNQVNIYTLDTSLLKVKSVRTGKETYVPDGIDDIKSAFPEWNLSSHLCSLDKNLKVIPFSKGFMLLNLKKMQAQKRTVVIESVAVDEPTDSVVYAANFCGKKSKPVISYAQNSFTISYGVPVTYPQVSILYQYRLNNGKWSRPVKQTKKQYAGLREGEYTFEVRALLLDKVLSTDSVTFHILPPWYRTWAAWLFYLLMAGVIGWQLWLMEKRRVERQKAAAVKEKDTEVKQMKVEIDKLEYEKMELDLRHKSQEIANQAVNEARKNEILMNLKKEIRRVAARLQPETAKQCKQELLLINNKIDTNMEGDDVLKRFEEQFNLANNNFMQRLRDHYPNLSQNELMMCAYLKMNLSTKEIAPLLNLSVRGVETIRYRLRIKMNLDRKDNLTEYLNNLGTGANNI